MRISRRFSRCAAAGAASVLAAVSMTACSGSSSGSGSAAANAAASQSQADANANANENDVQVLNSLQLTPQELDSSFATDSSWSTWTDADPSKILLKQAWACTKNIIDTKQTTLQPVTTYFRADQLSGGAAGTPTAPPTPSAPTSGHSSSHKGSSSTSSPSGSNSTPAGDGNPAHWVVSTAIAYQSADAAQTAVGAMGTIDPSAANCGGPADKKPVVGGGIGEVAPSWDNSQGVFVYTDTGSGTTIAVVAQRRGRYVVLTYTRGYAKDDAGYYDLETGPDTGPAADAATAVLGLLTASLVGN
ncbi:hypothetical protein [Catenulispora pinisilvae]|uniref:hypothetical protein n=1 Tax=Catenulispora pinisilvae TaxID=2705253 RepID=UPI0018915A38|nr:hypothetical protein [Catenulispora pinisilvae]